ncbi:PKD domain-containing protein [uncultured Methanoregula sp.]|uniref:PKD domain-containing protein n=1 Tax=uncultured Methanoregula sp. TaxID=1005933 RepID=UPI0037492AEA
MLLCVLMAVPVAAGLAVSPWPKIGHDPKNTGQSPYSGAQAAAIKWNYTTGGAIQYSSPVLGPDGTIYIGNYGDSRVYALDPEGTIRWTYLTGGAIQSSPAIGADGTIYIGNEGDSKLYALNPDGTLRWTYTTGGGIVASPAIGPDGTIYFGNTGPDTKLYALNPDGTLRWSFSAGGLIYNTPAIGTDGTIYFGNYQDHYIYALNPDGTLRWRYYTGGSAFFVYGSPVIGSDGTLYIGLVNTGDQNKLLALNPDGTPRWTYNTGNGRIYGSVAVGADGTICFGSDDSKFYALNPDGTLRWTYLSGGAFRNPSPAIGADGTIYIGNAGDRNVYALDRDGTLKWTFPTGGIKSWGSPAIGPDGTLYIGSTDGRIYAFSGVLDFTADQTRGKSPLAVQFTGTSALAPASWSWDFGDGTASTDQDPVHTYPSAGTYTVTLTTTAAPGTNTVTKTGYVTVLQGPPAAPHSAGIIPLTVNLSAPGSLAQAAPLATTGISPPAPEANFTADRTWGTSPLTVRFTDTSTGSPRSWSWDFGDGNTSARENPVYTYSQPGNYTVTLTAKNKGGSSTKTRSAPVTVLAKVIMPVPQFSVNTSSGVVPLWVGFSDTSTGPGISRWAWDFDNNGIIDSTDKDPVCVYNKPGNYTVNLTVTNNFGARTISRKDAIIADSLGPVVLFTANVTSGNQPLAVRFSDRSTGPGITGRAWDFNGDGTIDSTDKDPDCMYNTPGNYTVSLTVTNTSGAKKISKKDLITVGSLAPVAAFIANTTTGIPPLAVRFKDTSTGPAITGWAWDFNSDGIIDSTEQDPVCVYNKPGNYTVSLTGTNAYGANTTSREGSVTVTNGAVIDFTANQTAGTLPLAVRFKDTSTGLNITGWAWDFNNDGTIDSTEQDPVCVYNKPGNYTVSLTGTNALGPVTKSRKEFILAISSAPVAGFVANTTTGIPPLAVRFKDTSTGPAITGWAWDFNSDGTIDSTEQDPVCVYSVSGNATVTLRVTNRYGSDSITREDFVTVSSGAPHARFALNKTSGFAPLPVQFRDISDGTNITRRAWDFNGDGIVDSTEQDPSCVYNLPGAYSITFTVTNAQGSDTIVRKKFVTVT